MRLTPILLFSFLTSFLFCFTSTTAYKSIGEIENVDKLNHGQTLTREKREAEDFNEQYSGEGLQESQEEPGFWDRVVKVALKLFNRFMEWLNSS